MGQKTHPYGFRLGVIKTWTSKWYEDKQYTQWLHEDLRIKRAVKDYLYNANIAGVEVERAANKAKVIVFTARPGMVIGKGGKGIETLKVGNLQSAAKGEPKFPGVQAFTSNEVFIDVQEVRKPETNAQLVAENIATQLERRVAFRRAMKKAVATSMKFGAKGIRVRCSGRLGGAEMSRVETYREGRVPLHTLRADIEFGLAEARTTYGVIGVKVWMFKGEVLQRKARRIPGPLKRRRRFHAFSQANQVPQAAEGQQPRHRLPR
jgi:small subunit ribosomal protein S3